MHISYLSCILFKAHHKQVCKSFVLIDQNLLKCLHPLKGNLCKAINSQMCPSHLRLSIILVQKIFPSTANIMCTIQINRDQKIFLNLIKPNLSTRYLAKKPARRTLRRRFIYNRSCLSRKMITLPNYLKSSSLAVAISFF